MTPLDARQYNTRAGGPSFPLRNRLLRAAWMLTWTLFAAWTPAPLRRWRTFLLRSFGARLDAGTDVRGSARVWYPPHLSMEAGAVLADRVICYNMAPITLRAGAIVSQGAHLCAGTHDIDDPAFQLLARPIEIGRGAWIAAEAFVGPGVTVGHHAVVGARAVAMRDVGGCSIVVGNPAKPLRRMRRVDEDACDAARTDRPDG